MGVNVYEKIIFIYKEASRHTVSLTTVLLLFLSAFTAEKVHYKPHLINHFFSHTEKWTEKVWIHREMIVEHAWSFFMSF